MLQNGQPPINSLLLIIFALIETRFSDSQFISNWATKIVKAIASPQMWLFDLAFCIDSDKMLDILRLKINEEGIFFDDYDCFHKLCLGFLFLRYESGSIGYVDLQGEVADIVDAVGGIDGIDVECVYTHFSSEKSIVDADSELGQMLKSCAEEARRSIAYVSSEEMLGNEHALLSY